MTISVREYEQLKAKVEKLQREADKAEGVHAEQMRRLRQDFNCKTLEDAVAKQNDLEKKLQAEEKKLQKMTDKFEKDWGSVLEEL